MIHASEISFQFGILEVDIISNPISSNLIYSYLKTASVEWIRDYMRKCIKARFPDEFAFAKRNDITEIAQCDWLAKNFSWQILSPSNHIPEIRLAMQ